MMAAGEVPETIVFDAEPLVAYFCDEPGIDPVETYVDAVMGSSEGYISSVNVAEVHHIVRAIEGEERADAVIDVGRRTRRSVLPARLADEDGCTRATFDEGATIRPPP